MQKTSVSIGDVFGELTVVDVRVEFIYNQNYKCAICDCSCGKKGIKITIGDLIRTRKSCGCSSGKYRKRPNIFEINEDFVVGYTNDNHKFYFDLEDYELIKKYTWCKRYDGYIITNDNGNIIRMHRLVTNVDENLVVDHINHIAEDNRKINLRICTQQENSRNNTLSKNNTTECTGVSFHKESNKYRAYINVNRKQIYLGLYTKIEDAIKVRKTAEIKYFGEHRYQADIEAKS